MRVSVLFQLRRSKLKSDGKFPLYLRCTMAGKRFEISTGNFVDEITSLKRNRNSLPNKHQ